MKPHAISGIFPEMAGEDFAALKADIAAHGQQEAIVVFDGQILDGRNRFRACKELGIEPKRRNWVNGKSPVDFVVSVNLHRRHLTSSQRAMVALEIEKELAKEAKERQRKAGARGSEGGRGKKKPSVKELNKGNRAADQAAALTRTNRQYVSDAKKIASKAPKLAEKVKQGRLTIQQAKREIKRTEAKRKLAAWKAKP
ncbi:MAG: ParB N-terminal domain-containing protein, partial [Pyrinomonadaceae bacterium]